MLPHLLGIRRLRTNKKIRVKGEDEIIYRMAKKGRGKFLVQSQRGSPCKL